MKSITTAIVIWLFLLASLPSLWAQTASTGALTGTVTDASGAVVPNATVTITNSATGQNLTTTTGTNGSYRFSLLPPGTYSVKVEAKGFKTAAVAAIIVNVTETPAYDAKLEVGAAAEQITVSSTVETLQTETAALGAVVDSRAVTAIPLSTRNYTQIMALSSGAVGNVNNAGNLGKGSQDIAVNGQSTLSNNYSLNGSDANNWAVDTTTDLVGQFTGIAIPSPDAIAEFKVQTSQYDAGYGRSSGANVNVVTKSGGNEIHGSAFEYVRNTVFNANDFFRNETGEPTPVLKQNQFGGTVGGPIKKNKLFYFGSYQGTRQTNGLDTTALTSAFLPALTNDRSAATLGSEFCPANKPNPSNYTTFAGGEQVACDGSNINSVALAILNLKLPNGSYVIPNPQKIINGEGFSWFSIPSTYHEDQYIINTDYLISSTETLAARYFYSRQPQLQSFGLGSPTAVPGSPASITNKNHNASLTLTSVLTNNLVNEVKGSYTHFENINTTLGLPTAASIGLTTVDSKATLAPEMLITGGAQGQFQWFGNDANDFYGKTVVYAISDQISWVHGKQTIRIGGSFQPQWFSYAGIGRARGHVTFQSFDDFLLGLSAAQNGSPSGQSNVFSTTSVVGSGSAGDFVVGVIQHSANAFVQDDIKLTSRLTVNAGLRWEYIPGPYDTHGETSNYLASQALTVPIPPPGGTLAGVQVSSLFNPGFIDPFTGQPLGLPPGVVKSPTKGVFTNDAPKDGFAPRFGFAWQPGRLKSRLVVRGGYGWFYNSIGGVYTLTSSYRTQPFGENVALTGAGNGAATLEVPGVATVGYNPRFVNTSYTDYGVGPAQQYPRIQNWSLNAQFTLFRDAVLEVGYVGNRGNDINIGLDENQAQIATASNPVNCGLPNTAAGLGVSAATFATLGINSAGCVTTNTAANARYRVPVVGEAPTAMATTNIFIGNSSFDSLQATLRRQMTHGLSMQVAYTWSKSLNTNPVDNQTLPVSAYNSPSSYNRAQRFVASYVYDLPTPYNDRAFGKALLDGWSVSGVTTVQSGLPMNLTDPTGGGAYGLLGTSTVTLAPGMTYADLKTNNGGIHNYLNKAAVIPPVAVGTTTGWGTIPEYVVTGPGQFNWDISIGKVTTVGGLREDAQLLFRTEFYNAFNHPQFNNPVTNFGSSSYGQVTSASVSPRIIQFGLRYVF